MGKLQSYKQRNPQAFTRNTNTTGTSTPQQVLNLPVKVKGYELGGTLETNFLLGQRLDTGTDVKVRLFEIDQTDKKYKRVEISEFGDEKNKKRYLPIGCHCVFEGAKEDPEGGEGVFTARWCAVLDNRDPDIVNVVVLPASLSHGKNENNKENGEWFQIRALPRKPDVINSIEVFDSLVVKYLKPKFDGSRPRIFVRITDDTGDKEVFEIKPKTEIVKINERDINQVCKDSTLSLNNFKEEKSDIYDMIKELSGDPDVTIEVIPSFVVYPGFETRNKLIDQNENSKKHLVEGFYVSKESPESLESENSNNGESESVPESEPESRPKYQEIGYNFCILALRAYPDGSPYLTYIKPLYEYNKATSIKDMTVFTLKK